MKSQAGGMGRKLADDNIGLNAKLKKSNVWGAENGIAPSTVYYWKRQL